ncbi:hypothetical protein [Rhizobium sp. RU36D]|uniref:hypothetical protein n=1 Tax=Rhizobium sp. RU36D TaxID=1907415 RepID=UPI001FCD240A|nr:hypothetical protein [Rhizobium sp. RU36D]
MILPTVALAAEPAVEVRQSTDPIHAAVATDNSIDKLLSDLKRERKPEGANTIANRVMARWSDSGSATVNLLLKWAEDAAKEKKNAAALDFLDQAIVLAPDSVAAWNRRATLHYTMGQYRKSMADINHVLKLEPRHFGALAGMAAILSESGRDAMALAAWERYLDIYPADRQAQDVVSKLSEKLAGSRT